MDHVEGRLAFLKAELKIIDAQAPLWGKFAEAHAHGRPADGRDAPADGNGGRGSRNGFGTLLPTGAISAPLRLRVTAAAA